MACSGLRAVPAVCRAGSPRVSTSIRRPTSLASSSLLHCTAPLTHPQPNRPSNHPNCHWQVRSIAEMGAYVSLLEYGGIEGMILLSELSRRRIRSVQKLIKVGRQEPVMVLRVDKEKGYIDLSKRRVSPEDLAVSWRSRGGQGGRTVAVVGGCGWQGASWREGAGG